MSNLLLLAPIIIDAPQRSPEWFEARLGKVTGSMASATMDYYVPYKKDIDLAIAEHQQMETPEEIINRLAELYPTELVVSAGIDLKEKASRKAYRENIVAERLTGLPSNGDSFVNEAMKWGVASESLAVARYQLQTMTRVDPAPFMLHPELACGASPDGLVVDMNTGELGNIEVKCLRTANHLYKIIKKQSVPEEYIPQIQMQMWIGARGFCDFIGFDSRLKEGLKVFVKRVERDDFYIEYVLAPAIERFLDQCDRDVKQFWAMIKEDE